MKDKKIIILTGMMIVLTLFIIVSIFLKLYYIMILLLVLLISIKLSIIIYIYKLTPIQERKIKRYKKLKKIGSSPFLLVLSIGILNMFFGTEILSFFGGKYYGIDALIATILFFSYYIWPIYIVGIILITISNKKLKQFNNEYKEQNEN